MSKVLTTNQLRRIPRYLSYLRTLNASNISYVSCQQIAKSLSLNEEQVRKDIALVSKVNGVPNKGRNIEILIKDIESTLGIDNVNDAILVGVGSLGTALLNYKGFLNYGLQIIGAFDKDINLVGKTINGIMVYDINEVDLVLKKLKAPIGIITVPSNNANEVANLLVKAGIEAIWNFAPTQINVNDDVIVTNIDMAANLATLSHKLYLKHRKIEKENM